MAKAMRVLLVEDEAILAMHLEQMLGGMGYAVLPPVASGEDAVDQAKRHHPDIVIMDIHLAGKMNGFTAARQIQTFLDAPIVYLTGHSNDATLTDATQTGPYAFLVKPVSQKELRASLEVVLHRHALDRKLRESEDRYRSIVENINDALVIHDFTGTVIDVNENFCKMFGYARDELIGTNVSLFSRPEAPCHQTEIMAELRKTSALVFETRCVGKDGKHVPVEASARVVSRASAEVVQCFLRDISDRKEQERRLRETNDRLEKAIADKDKLHGIIAHDLRSPLTGVLAFTRLLASKVDTFSVEDLRKCAREMQLTVEGVYELLENLLEWSTLQQGLFENQPAPLLLADLVEKTIKMMHAVCQQKKVVMENHVPAHLVAYADPAMAKTVFRNLLGNALKFSRQGGRVQVFAESDGALVTVAVQDEGVGMEPEVRDALFRTDRVQSHKGTRGERGTGLGLLLCAELLQQLRGTIWVQSSPGQGTTFFFTLPCESSISR